MADAIKKAVDIYIRKYEKTSDSFINFINEKVVVSSFQLDCITDKIKSLDKEEPLSKNNIELFLHVIAAVQAKGGETAEMKQNQLTKYHKINFKSSKNKKKNNYSEDAKQQSQRNNFSQIVAEQSRNKEPQQQSPTSTKKEEKVYEEIDDEHIQNEHREQEEMEMQPVYSQIEFPSLLSQDSDKPKASLQKPKMLSPEKQQKSIIHSPNFRAMHDITEQNSIELANNSVSQSIPKPKEKDSNKNQSNRTKDNQNNYKPAEFGGENESSERERRSSQNIQHFMTYNQNPTAPNIRITHYEKTSQDYTTVVIKYHIIYGQKRVWRRYSEFERLMSYLNRKYEGIILPQMPPKQGFKANLTYLLGLDDEFLNARREKLENLLKRLLNSRFVQSDEVLKKFLNEDSFEVDVNMESAPMFYLNTIKQIAMNFNAKELKDYGMAYYKYISESKNNLNSQIDKCYEAIKSLAQQFIDMNTYRTKINENFQRRREVMAKYSIRTRTAVKTEFDKILEETTAQINDLNNQFQRYVKLKSEENWLNYLIQQKTDPDEKKDYKERLDCVLQRIQKMEKNLLESMNEFKIGKDDTLKRLGKELSQWRSSIHP